MAFEHLDSSVSIGLSDQAVRARPNVAQTDRRGGTSVAVLGLVRVEKRSATALAATRWGLGYPPSTADRAEPWAQPTDPPPRHSGPCRPTVCQETCECRLASASGLSAPPSSQPAPGGSWRKSLAWRTFPRSSSFSRLWSSHRTTAVEPPLRGYRPQLPQHFSLPGPHRRGLTSSSRPPLRGNSWIHEVPWGSGCQGDNRAKV